MTNEKTSNQAPEHHPTLKMASLEIKAILEKHDIAGVCVLHTAGFKEILVRVNPSYSCIEIDELRRLKVNKPIEDPNDPEKAAKPVADSINMLAHMQMSLFQLSKIFEQSIIAVRMTFGMMPKPGPIPPKFINGKKNN